MRKGTKDMPAKIVTSHETYKCPSCGFEWKWTYELDFDENERVPCCPVAAN